MINISFDCHFQGTGKIGSGVYRSEQPSHEDFKALEKYGIGEALNLRNRHSDDDEAAGTNVTYHSFNTTFQQDMYLHKITY